MLTTSKIISLGSCFAQEIGQRMHSEGFDILNNPFGVLYNPASISSSINRIVSCDLFTEEDIIIRDPHYNSKARIKKTSEIPQSSTPHRPIASSPFGSVSFFHHGSFTRDTPEEFLQNANTQLKAAHEFYKQSEYAIITFGTSLVYRHIEKDLIVSNCHKHLAKDFKQERLTVDEIVATYRELIPLFSHWIFTVSPIRHIKDGLHQNQLSKATLLLAIDQLCKEFPDRTSYFPAYEIVLDELRDYKHYAEDKMHPNTDTINYIWEQFSLNLKK